MANYKMLSDRAKSVADMPFQQYQGEMVAGLTPTQEAGIQNVNAAAGLAQPYYQAGAGYVQQAATPFGQQQLNQYMSPYIGSVANATMANLNETNAQQRQQLLGNSISQGAFGGDRGGIAQAELARQQNLASGQTLANLYQGGYGQALGQFNADQARQLQAGSTLGQFGTGAQTAALQGAQAQLGAGAQQQAVRQAQDVANQQQFQAAQAYPFQTTQYLANLLLGIGGQSGGTALTNSPGPNIGSQILGGLTSLASIPWGSDERLKENMEPVGETYDGQKIYKFNYKNDGHTMLGLSAQEVEKHHPDAVHKDGEGMRMVDYEKAVNGAAQRGHFADGGLAGWMGGGVHADGLGRAHFELGGMPYSDQPSGGSTKPLTLADVMRVSESLLSKKPGGKTNIPDAPKAYEDTGMQDVAKQLVNATSEQRGNMKSNIAAIRSNLGLGTVAPADLIPATNYPNQYSMSGMMGRYADGGGVGRHGYAGDGAVQDPQQATQTSQDGQSLIERMTGKPMSDEARMGLLAAGLGMLSSKSPFFGVGVGEGATQGLGTYYNAIANKRAYEKQQRELELTEEQRKIERERLGIDRSRVGVDALSSVQRIYDDLNTRYSLLAGTGALTPEGLPKEGHPQERVATELYNRLQEQRKILMQIQGSALSGMGAKVGAGDPATTLARTVLTTPSVEGPAPVSAPAPVAPPAPAVAAPAMTPKVTEGEPATAPAVVVEPVKAPVTPPAPAIAAQADTTNNLYSGLPEDLQPQILIERSKAALATGDKVGAYNLREEAERIRKEVSEKGKILDANGNIVTVPGWNEWKKQQEMLPENLKLFAKYPETIMALEKAEMNNDLFAKIGENFEPNIFANVQGTAQAVGRAFGVNPTGANAEMKANIDRLAKDTNQALFADLKENVGPGQRLLQTEIQGQKFAEPTATIQPESYRTLVGQKVGLTNWLKDYYKDAGSERKRVGDTKFDGQEFTQKWIDSHKLGKYIDDATSNIAVKGATPLNEPNRMISGQMYIVDKDPQGKPLEKPVKARFVGINSNTKKYQWTDVSPVQVVR